MIGARGGPVGRNPERKPIIPGIYAMLLTPLRAYSKFGREIDFDALNAEARWAIQQGATGLVICPSIGEFVSLTDQERWECFAVVYDMVRGLYGNHIRMVAMTAAPDTLKMLKHAELAKAIGYDAQQLIPPYYWNVDEDEVLDFYKAACDTELPVVVYHNPKLSKFEMSRKFMGKLARLEGVVAIKEVKTDRQIFLEPLVEELKDTNTLWFSTYRAFHDSFLLGSSGGFINAQALPVIIKMNEMLKRGEIMRASRIQEMLNKVFPRGGEANPRHIGTNKMAASFVTGIKMGPPFHPYKLPGQWFEEHLKENYPKLLEMLKD